MKVRFDFDQNGDDCMERNANTVVWFWRWEAYNSLAGIFEDEQAFASKNLSMNCRPV